MTFGAPETLQGPTKNRFRIPCTSADVEANLVLGLYMVSRRQTSEDRVVEDSRAVTGDVSRGRALSRPA